VQLQAMWFGVTATDAGSGVTTITIPDQIIVQDEGTPVTSTPHTTLNFVGSGVAATDGGAGVATITIISNIVQIFWAQPNFAVVPSSNPANMASRNSHPIIEFDQSTQQFILFLGVMSENYLNGNLIVDIDWIAESATTGDVVWGCCPANHDRYYVGHFRNNYSNQL